MPVPETPDRGFSLGQVASDAFKQAAADLAVCLRFFSRLPVPRLPWEPTLHALPDFRRMPRMAPVAGAVIGGLAALVLLLAGALGFGPWVSAALGVTALVILTGGLHEDGLADTADGFGGGKTVERRLDIMRDSRVGSFGAIAIALSLVLRIVVLGTLGERLEAAAVAAALIVAGALSRTAALGPMAALQPARASGSSHAVGQPSWTTVATASTIAGAIGAGFSLASGLPLLGLLSACALAAAAAFGMTRLSFRLIGGQTGDVIGATQQIAEIAALVGLLIAFGA
jgi:adenosylcobinamide-GDP ribazoletransferase